MAFISNSEINSIRASVDIVDVIGSYLSLTQKGKNFSCKCPFHDDNSPSLSVSREKQIYKCFACGAAGNVFTFVSEYENVPFIEAVRIVAEKAGLEVSKETYDNNTSTKFKDEYAIMDLAEKFFQNNLKTRYGLTALNYLKERGLDDDAIKEFGIGLSLDESDTLASLLKKKNYSNEQLSELGLTNDNNHDFFTHRITFPLYDKDGHIVGFSARVYRGEKDTSKYVNTKETKIFKKGETLYNYHLASTAAKREKSIIVVEGFMDAIRISLNGIKNVVALQGTAMTNEQITLLKKLRCKIILCLDNDNAGLNATLVNGEELIKNELDVYVIRLSGEKDPDEYILKNGIDSFKANVNKPLSFFEFKMNTLKQNKNLDNVEDLTDYINDVLKTLVNSDEILREVTLTKLSTEYNLSIDILKDKLKQLSPEKKLPPKMVEERIPQVEKKDAYKISCEKILYMMMNGVEYVREYQHKLGFFSEQIYRNIANEIVYYVESNGNINEADFISYISTKDDIKEKTMEIVKEAINDEVSLESMDDYLTAISKIMTKQKISKLKNDLKNELDVDKKMKITMQIAELKKEVF